MIITSPQKKELISKLADQTKTGKLKWDRIGHHQPSPTSIMQFIYGLNSEYVFDDSFWTPYKNGYFCLLHTVYDPSIIGNTEQMKLFNETFDLNKLSHNFLPVSDNASKYKTNYKLLVQSDEFIVPELIPPAGEPMDDELYALSEIIKRANSKNQEFVEMFLADSK